MGSYADAPALPITSLNHPDITQIRRVRTNYGFVASIEQAITDDLGVFSRSSWSPGLVEILGSTDCSESLSFDRGPVSIYSARGSNEARAMDNRQTHSFSFRTEGGGRWPAAPDHRWQ